MSTSKILFCFWPKETNKNPSHNLALYKAVLARMLCYLSKKYGSKKIIIMYTSFSQIWHAFSDGLDWVLKKLGFVHINECKKWRKSLFNSISCIDLSNRENPISETQLISKKYLVLLELLFFSIQTLCVGWKFFPYWFSHFHVNWHHPMPKMYSL